jgi:hypothetical protein
MKTEKPTELAESYCHLANDSFVYVFQHAKYPSNEYNMASGCNNLAMALKHLSVGLRATS